VSDLSGPQPEELAPSAGSSAHAAAQAGATAVPPPIPAEPAPARPISPDAATGWTTLVFIIAQAIGTAVVLIWYAGELPASKSYDGTLVALVTLITNPVLVGLFWLVVRRRGLDAREYLGLTRFTVRDFLVGVLAIAGLAAVLYGVAHVANLDMVPTFQTDSFTSARRAGWLIPLLLAVVLIGPIGEEIMFRGFLYRGWVRPGSLVTPILTITVLWSAMHLQYDWFGITQVFLIGLVLGWLRWRSGSTSLTIALHVLVNLEATIETFIKVGWSAT
jgi:membrane protease YdiL (CAAX protease family)